MYFMGFLRFVSRMAFHPLVGVRTIITVVYLGIALFVNFFVLQVFCMPVVYAAVMCILFLASIVVFPLLNNGKIKTIAYALLGTGVPICSYMIFFLADPIHSFLNYIWFTLQILLFGAGLLAFIPFYFLYHISKYYRQGNTIQKQILWAGVITPCIALFIYLIGFHSYFNNADRIARTAKNKTEFIGRLPSNYFTERVLGLYWKYHTNLEYIYDGWRPPLHDPFLVLAWYVFSSELRPGKSHMWPDCNEEGVRYYHRKFPGKPLKVWCPCAYSHDGLEYGPDSLWYGPPEYLKEMNTIHGRH